MNLDRASPAGVDAYQLTVTSNVNYEYDYARVHCLLLRARPTGREAEDRGCVVSSDDLVLEGLE
jgi:hypothetical protein